MQAVEGNGLSFADTATPTEGQIATKAVVRTASKLRIPNKALATAIGVSEATVSRMVQGTYTLDKGSKPFELGLLLVRVYRSLDAIMGGDDKASASWLRNENLALGGVPFDLIQSVSGITNVLAYLDARRAIV